MSLVFPSRRLLRDVFDDAVTASRVLDLTLTGRDCGLDERAPMCGVPYHAVDNYIRKLIENGYRVAICEQLSDPATSKGLVDRDVVRVVSSGTVMEEDILDEKSSNYLCSVFTNPQGFGIAWADISTGEFNVYEYVGDNSLDRLSNLLGSISPSEIICNDDFVGKYQKVQYFVSSDKRARCYHDLHTRSLRQRNAFVRHSKSHRCRCSNSTTKKRRMRSGRTSRISCANSKAFARTTRKNHVPTRQIVHDARHGNTSQSRTYRTCARRQESRLAFERT